MGNRIRRRKKKKKKKMMIPTEKRKKERTAKTRANLENKTCATGIEAKGLVVERV